MATTDGPEKKRPSAPGPTAPRVYRVAEAADLLGVSADTVRRWSDSGKLASSRDAGGRRVIEGAALAELAAQLGRGPGTEVGPTAAAFRPQPFPGDRDQGDQRSGYGPGGDAGRPVPGGVPYEP